MNLSSTVRRHNRWLSLSAVLAPAVLAGTLVTALAVGAIGFVVPVLAIGALMATRTLMGCTTTRATRATVREVMCALIAAAAGFGTWVAAIVLGIMVDVLPFIGGGDYPYEDEWTAASVVVAAASVPLAWWLTRRAVDPELT